MVQNIVFIIMMAVAVAAGVVTVVYEFGGGKSGAPEETKEAEHQEKEGEK